MIAACKRISASRCRRSPAASLLYLAVIALGSGMLSGCAALTNPVANGIPVRLVPPELLAGPREEEMQTIPLSLLRQNPPKIYRLAAGDVLGIYIEGVLPAITPNQPRENPPVYFPSQIDPLARGLPPSMGYPIPVRDDGTVALPLIAPLQVTGKSLAEAEAAIREAYVGQGFLRPGTERIFVSLMQPRMVRVTVIRQESGGFTSGGLGGIISTSSKRGTGHVVNLRVYENDVLTALAETGGLPGLDAYNSVIVFKRADGNPALIQSLESLPAGQEPSLAAASCPRVIQIPLRGILASKLPIGRRTSSWKTVTSCSWKPATSSCSTPEASCPPASSSCRATMTWTSSKPW